MEEYEREFNWLIKFVPVEVRNNEHTKIQKIFIGLEPKFQSVVQSFKPNTYTVVSKAQIIEQNQKKGERG